MSTKSLPENGSFIVGSGGWIHCYEACDSFTLLTNYHTGKRLVFSVASFQKHWETGFYQPVSKSVDTAELKAGFRFSAHHQESN
jgi:hypothetical protein